MALTSSVCNRLVRLRMPSATQRAGSSRCRCPSAQCWQNGLAPNACIRASSRAGPIRVTARSRPTDEDEDRTRQRVHGHRARHGLRLVRRCFPNVRCLGTRRPDWPTRQLCETCHQAGENALGGPAAQAQRRALQRDLHQSGSQPLFISSVRRLLSVRVNH